MKLFHFIIDEETYYTDNFIVVADNEEQGKELIKADYSPDKHEYFNKHLKVEYSLDLDEARPEVFATIPQSFD